MNISKISSFNCKNMNFTGSGEFNAAVNAVAEMQKRQYPQNDTYVGRRPQPKNNKSGKMRRAGALALSHFLSLITGASLYAGAQALKNEPLPEVPEIPAVTSVHLTNSDEITDTLNTYGDDLSLRAILDFNGAHNIETLLNGTIYIPTMYNPLDDEIERCREELFSSNAEDNSQTKKRLELLLKKQELQNEIIEYMFTDGKYLYIKTKPVSQKDMSHSLRKAAGYSDTIPYELALRISGLSTEEPSRSDYEDYQPPHPEYGSLYDTAKEVMGRGMKVQGTYFVVIPLSFVPKGEDIDPLEDLF